MTPQEELKLAEWEKKFDERFVKGMEIIVNGIAEPNEYKESIKLFIRQTLFASQQSLKEKVKMRNNVLPTSVKR